MELVNESFNKKVNFLRRVIGTGEKLFESLVLEKITLSQRVGMVNFLLSPAPQYSSKKLTINKFRKQGHRS